MATQQEFTIDMAAGEVSIKAYRRLKLSATAGQVLMADAADGDNWFAVSQNETSAIGDRVTCALRSPHRTFKMECAGAVADNALLFPTDDGRVDDAVTKNTPCGVSRGAVGAAGQIIEVLPLPLAAGDMYLAHVVASGSGDAAMLKPSRKMLLVDWWLIARDTGAANVKLRKNGATDMTGVTAKGTTDNAVVRGGTIIAAEDELLATDTLQANLSAAQAADVFALFKIIG